VDLQVIFIYKISKFIDSIVDLLLIYIIALVTTQVFTFRSEELRRIPLNGALWEAANAKFAGDTKA
jgi:hypothetical protein